MAEQMANRLLTLDEAAKDISRMMNEALAKLSTDDERREFMSLVTDWMMSVPYQGQRERGARSAGANDEYALVRDALVPCPICRRMDPECARKHDCYYAAQRKRT